MVLLSVFSPSAVLAESAIPACSLGRIWPSSGDLAADHPAFIVPTYGAFEDRTAVLELWESVGDAEPTLVASTTRSVFSETEGHLFVVTPSAPLTVGASVELRGDTCPRFGNGDVSVVYRVTDEAATPPAPPLRLTTGVYAYASEGYLEWFSARTTLTVEGGGVIAEWRPWFQTEVGIGTTPLQHTTGAGRDASQSVALACEGFEGIPPGDHPIAGALRTLDGDLVGEVSEIARFDCADARYIDYNGRELSAREVAGLRRRPVGVDAGFGQDAGPGSAMDAGPGDEVGSGGCSAGVGAGASGAVWMLVLAALRRRRSRI